MRRVLALTITMTLSLALPAAAGGGPNNVVTASPTNDGAVLHRSSVQVTSTGSKSVTSSNLAYATPHDCTGCEGIAVAFQAVIVTGGSSTISPTNAAVAVNTQCTSCGAFAYAYQYVVRADRGTHLSKSGRGKVDDIRREAAAATNAGLSYPELDAKLTALAADFKAAVAADLERSGSDPHGDQPDADTDEAPADS
jgi:putative peptide zinc metalloprotease protein